MSKRAFPLDRSAMFTALLDLDPGFGPLDSEQGRLRVSAALADWYADETATDMYVFARDWSAPHPIDKEQ